MLVICEICYNNVVDELSARKGETVCVLCKKEIKRKEREEKKKVREEEKLKEKEEKEQIKQEQRNKKVCKICGFEGSVDLFAKGRSTCKKCYAEHWRRERHEHPKKVIAHRKYVTLTDEQYDKMCNHKYYLAHKQESLERTRRNRAKKKQCT